MYKGRNVFKYNTGSLKIAQGIELGEKFLFDIWKRFSRVVCTNFTSNLASFFIKISCNNRIRVSYKVAESRREEKRRSPFFFAFSSVWRLLETMSRLLRSAFFVLRLDRSAIMLVRLLWALVWLRFWTLWPLLRVLMKLRSLWHRLL